MARDLHDVLVYNGSIIRRPSTEHRGRDPHTNSVETINKTTDRMSYERGAWARVRGAQEHLGRDG